MNNLVSLRQCFWLQNTLKFCHCHCFELLPEFSALLLKKYFIDHIPNQIPNPKPSSKSLYGRYCNNVIWRHCFENYTLVYCYLKSLIFLLLYEYNLR